MNLVLTGLSHHTAPLDVRERMVFDAASLPMGLKRLAEIAPHEEALLVSTCNRTEVLLRGRETEALPGQVRQFLLEKSGLDTTRLDPALYVHRDQDAVRHIFRVASSLDSLVVGEPQILKQVKDAHRCALQERRLGPVLDGLCRRAFHAAKRVRTETAIARNPVSIAYSASELARTIFGNLEGCSVLVLGAGEMSELTLRHLVSLGIETVYVANRHYERAVELAQKVAGSAVAFDRMRDCLVRVDIVISSTAAPHLILLRDDVAQLMRRRRNRPVFFIDIAVPRDIDPAANDLDNVYLYDVDDLQRVVDENIEERRREAVNAEGIIEAEVAAFQRWYLGLAAGPTITSLRRALHELRRAEMERFRSRLADLNPAEHAAVEAFARGLVNKILHAPTLELRRSVDGRSAPGQVDMVRRMFGLDEADTGDGPRPVEAAAENDAENGDAAPAEHGGADRRRGGLA